MEELGQTLLQLLLVPLLALCPASAISPCFELQSFDASLQCADVALENTTMPSSDCWRAKIQADYASGDAGSGAVEQLLMNRSTGECHLLSTRCLLESLPPTGFQSWLPCRSAAAPSVSHLIFTIKAGVGVKSWGAFVNISGNATMISKAIEDTDQPDVFRSNVLDNLGALPVLLSLNEIHLVVYRSGSPALKLTFGATKMPITKRNWFASDNLKASWPLTNVANRSFNYFSVDGHVSLTSGWTFERRFFINYYYGGCPVDTGLLMVMDIDDVCDYAKGGFIAAPRILFNVRPDGFWPSGVERAERFSIYVV